MELSSFQLLALFTTLTVTLAQQEQPIAPQSTQQAPQSLGVRYSASTDVSHVSFNSPLATYGDALNEIQLPAAPIQPANLKQAPQEEQSSGEGQEVQGLALVRSGSEAQDRQPQNQVTQALQSQSIPNQQQFISVQQYPARPQLQTTPRGFSLSQNLPGLQPQIATRYATQPQPAPIQYSTAQPQQYASNQVAYSSPSSNANFATGHFASQYPASDLRQYSSQPVASQYPQQVPQYVQPVASQYPQQVPQYVQPVALQYPQQVPQYVQPVASQYPQQVPQYAQPVASQYPQQVTQYAQPLTSQYPQQLPQYAGQGELPGAPTQIVARVSFNGPAGGFSYGF